MLTIYRNLFSSNGLKIKFRGLSPSLAFPSFITFNFCFIFIYPENLMCLAWGWKCLIFFFCLILRDPTWHPKIMSCFVNLSFTIPENFIDLKMVQIFEVCKTHFGDPSSRIVTSPFFMCYFSSIPTYPERSIYPTSTVWNQIFYYTRCDTLKCITSLRGPSPRHCARATQLLSKKCRSGGEPLATLCAIWPSDLPF